MKKYLTILFLSFFSILLTISSFAQNEKILVTDLTKIKQIGGVSFSPNGKQAVYTVNSIETDADNNDEYKYLTQIFLTDFQNNSQPLTRGMESSRQPTWSPDGKKLAFLRTVKGKSQIFILPLNGGEAFQLTKSKYGVSNPVWSPDSKKILYSMSLSFSELMKDSLFNPAKQPPLWSLEKPGFAKNEQIKINNKTKPNPDGNLDEIRAYLEKDVADKKAKVFNRLNFQGEAGTEPEMSFSHLAVIEVSENNKNETLTKGFYSFSQASFTPNGKQIVYIASGNGENIHPDRDMESRIFVMDANGENYKLVYAEKGKVLSGPMLSPDGQTMVYQSNPIIGINIPKLYITHFSVSASMGTEIAFDRSISKIKFSPDNSFLYFSAQSNGGQPLFRHDLKTKKTEPLSDYNSGISDFDISKDKIVFAKIEVSNPCELYSADLLLKNQQKLTSYNTLWLKSKKLSFPEKRYFTNSIGQKVEYWIMKPTFAEAGKKYPLMLQIHGGPQAMWGPGEQSMWHEMQYFCSQGYGVVYSNPRGSGGYGIDFLKGNYQDWGTGPAEDVLKAENEAAKENWSDTSKQVITGGSYAGYLTGWIVGHDHRFKAAFAQRGVYELTTFMGEGNAWRLIPFYFGGYPWQPEIQKIMDENSPYTFIDKIKTPLLIKHGENDLRTGVIQSEMMYKSLKIMGKEVEYVRMPEGTHELSRTGNVRQRIDRILRIYEFMERYIGK